VSQYLTPAGIPADRCDGGERITFIPGPTRKECDIRYAQTTVLADLRSGPVIFWAAFAMTGPFASGRIFASASCNCHGGSNWIEDGTNPTSRQWAVERTAPYDQVNRDYGLITVLLTRRRDSGGLGLPASQGSVLSPRNKYSPTHGDEYTHRQITNNWDHKNLQIVLEIPMVKGSAGTPRIVATYSW